MFYGALFILGAVVGGLIGLTLSVIIGLNGGATAIAAGTLAIVTGILALLLHKSIIRMATAFYGAGMAASGASILIVPDHDMIDLAGDPTAFGDSTVTSIILLSITIVLGLSGTLFQMGLLGKKK